MKENINFWHMQMFPDENPQFSEQIPKILQHYNIIGLGDWQDKRGQINDFCHKMKVNDIVAIKFGKKLIALVQVIGGEYSISQKDDNELNWIVHRRPIRVLDWALDGEELPQPRGSLNICSNDDVETTQIIKTWFEKVKKSFEAREIAIFV